MRTHGPFPPPRASVPPPSDLTPYKRPRKEPAPPRLLTPLAAPHHPARPSPTCADTEFMKAGARGISLLYASGDEGANCKSGTFVPEGPGSSPYVTAVGGTTQTSSYPSPGPASERGVGLSSGGFSSYWAMPDWQSTQVQRLPPAATSRHQRPRPSVRGICAGRRAPRPTDRLLARTSLLYMAGGPLPLHGGRALGLVAWIQRERPCLYALLPERPRPARTPSSARTPMSRSNACDHARPCDHATICGACAEGACSIARAVVADPDISAQATNFCVTPFGCGVAGTSCASPTAAGIFALLNDLRLAAGVPCPVVART
jgi:hypothetical protein